MLHGLTIMCDQWVELLDELGIGAFTVGFDHQISSMNYTAQALMGLKENEVIGQDCREVFTGVPCMVQCLLSSNGNPTTEEPEVEFLNDAETKHLLTRLATPIFDRQQKVVGCLTILQDHTPIVDFLKLRQHARSSL